MGKKVKEYKTGDFIFAKVKGYPAWPARVQRLNGKKYFVYFYGTGETANLPPNMIFDYADNKDKFLGKAVKRRDFNEGVKQIEHDFVNNVPLEEVIGAGALEAPAEATDSANDTMDDSAMDTTAADDTVADTTASNATQNDTTVEDSDDAGALVIDEGKQQAKGRKPKVPEPAKTPKTPKTPRGKGKPAPGKEEDEEIVSRSGRKIRPKRYIDEQTEENATLPSPAPKRKRGASPQQEKEKEGEPKDKPADKQMKQFNNVSRSDLDELKEPFRPADAEKENILIAYLPSGQYVGIKVFGNRPANCKDAAARLHWDKRSARNALKMATDLERGHITPQSVMAQLVMDLNLTDEEKATLDKERETDEKKSRVQFLKTEMKLIELDAKIKTCLCLERADTALCLQLLDQLLELDVKPLMLLKHPTCLETVKRMRAYVGNTPSWDLTEQEALTFAKQAHRIRKQADMLYRNMKELFTPPPSLSFWEHFSERVLHFKRCTAALPADRLLEMHHEPREMSEPSVHSMSAAVEAAAGAGAEGEAKDAEAGETPKKKNARTKKAANSTPAKQTPRRQHSRKQIDKGKEVDTAAPAHAPAPAPAPAQPHEQADEPVDVVVAATQPEHNTEQGDSETTKETTPMEVTESEAPETTEANESSEATETTEKQSEKLVEKEKRDSDKDKEKEVSEKKETNDKPKRSGRSKKNGEKEEEISEKVKESSDKVKETHEKAKESSDKVKDVKTKESGEKTKDKTKEKSEKTKENSEKTKDISEKVKQSDKEKESGDNADEGSEKTKESEREKEAEPRAKRSRGENKKTDPPPRSPGRNPPRKSKA